MELAIADESMKDFKLQIGESLNMSAFFVTNEEEEEGVPRVLVDRHERKWHRSDRLLGRGASGEVWLGMGDTGMLTAIKSIKLPDAPTPDSRHLSPTNASTPSTPASPVSPASPCPMIPRRTFGRRHVSSEETFRRVDELVNEVNILKNVHHENIVNYHACVVTPHYAVVCMEYVAGGTLQAILDDFGSLPELAVQRYTLDALSGLRCLHSRNIMHRDLKPVNLLVTASGHCKLADFGAACCFAQDNAESVSTPVYMSPEACRGSFSCASDIWSLGIVMCQLYTGRLPYDFANHPYVPQRFLQKLGHDPSFLPGVPDGINRDAADFVGHCFVYDPEERYTADSLLETNYAKTVSASGSG